MSAARLLATCLLFGSFEVSAVEKVVWTYNVGGLVNGVEPLSNGHVLFPDKNGNRVLEVVPTRPSGGTVVWELDGVNQPDHARQAPNGDVLVTDTSNQKVTRFSRVQELPVWSFGDGAFACTPTSLGFPGDLSLADNGDYLIADQVNYRVLQVDTGGAIVWQYGDPGCVSGLGDNQLAAAFHAESLGGGNIMMVSGAGRIVRVVSQTLPAGGPKVWEYGTPGVQGTGPNQLSQPERAHRLANGNYLIADAGGERVIEVIPTFPSGGTIVWQYGVTNVPGTADGYLFHPYEAQRMSNGDTLIADHFNQRIVEVSPLRLVLASAQLEAGLCSAALLISVEDGYDQVSAVPADVQIALNVESGPIQIFADASCTTPLSALTVLSGQSQSMFFVRGSIKGSGTVNATAPGYLDGNVALQIRGPALRFTTPPQSLKRNECAPQALSVQLIDGTGGPLAVPGGSLPLLLHSSAPTTQFFSDADCATPLSAVPLSSGQSEVSFFVRDPFRGTPVLRVDAGGNIAPAEQPLLVGNPGEPLGVAWSCEAGPAEAPASLAALLALALSRWRRRRRT